MKNSAFCAVTALTWALFLSVDAAPKKDIQARERELEVLKQYLEEARDSLQREITDRWRMKQRAVEQREIDKEEISRLKEQQERAFAELSRMKEECFAKEKIIEDTRAEAARRSDEWGYVTATLTEGLEREARDILETNPLQLEARRKDVEEIRADFRLNKSVSHMLPRFVSYHEKYFAAERSISALRQTVMPDEGEPAMMSVVMFGSVWGYAVDDNGKPYLIRQTGKLGAGRYAVEPVGEASFAAYLQQSLPRWTGQGYIDGLVQLDVMQNANTGILISGKKIDTTTRLMAWFRAGGPVMIPLALLVVWALTLMIMKIVQFSRKHKSNKHLFDTVAGMLLKQETDKAYDFASKHTGVVAKVVTTCLKHSRWNRSAAEKAVKEILIDEVPQLNKHLATLAVIAGAAPLCGLLGTVTGMISLFEVITNYGTGDPKILAGGISEALITTEAGLIIAIPVLLMHNFLRNRSQHIQTEMERHAIRILNRLWPETE